MFWQENAWIGCEEDSFEYLWKEIILLDLWNHKDSLNYVGGYDEKFNDKPKDLSCLILDSFDKKTSINNNSYVFILRI